MFHALALSLISGGAVLVCAAVLALWLTPRATAQVRSLEESVEDLDKHLTNACAQSGELPEGAAVRS